jgi:hypothetical protein
MIEHTVGGIPMRKLLLTTAAILVIVGGSFTQNPVAADEAPLVRHGKKVRSICVGPGCGPHAPCGLRCRIACPDGYSCFPLYGAYGPYGGTGYWGGYTLSGWGPRW